jgi:hypothetical protein
VRAADHGTVIALRAAAAELQAYEEVVIVAVMEDEGGFDGFGVRREVGVAETEVGGLRARGERVSLGVGLAPGLGKQVGGAVELAHLDAGPEAAEGEPDIAFGVDHELGSMALKSSVA